MNGARLLLGFALCGVVALADVGCGGNVVVDGGGSGGAGGATSTTSASSSTSSSSGTTGADFRAACHDLCARAEQLGCGSLDPCLEGCLEVVDAAGACVDELSTYLGCLDRELTGCDPPPACMASYGAFQQCTGADECSSSSCTGGSDGSCSCSSTCNGATYEVACTPQPNGGSSCDCRIDGTSVGGCGDSSGTCTLRESCCAALFGF